MTSVITCAGTTQKGKRCRKRVHREGRRCHIHQTNDPETQDVRQCIGFTSTGKQCDVNPWGGYYCSLHTPISDFKMSLIVIETEHIVGIFNSYEKAEKDSSDLQIKLEKSHVCISRHLINQLNRELKDWSQRDTYYTETKFELGMSSMEVVALIDLINEFMGIGSIWYAINVNGFVSPCSLDYVEANKQKSNVNFYQIELNKLAKRGKIPVRNR